MGKEGAYPGIRPKSKRFKTLVVKVMMFCLGRGFQYLAARDPDLRRETGAWPDSTGLMFEVLPGGPRMSMRKENGRMRCLGLKGSDADLVIYFKNIDSAFLVFTGQMGTPQAFAEFRVSLKGDIAEAMRLIRCLNLVEFYLFPAFIARKVIKRLPRMGFARLFKGRLCAYLLGIPLGR